MKIEARSQKPGARMLAVVWLWLLAIAGARADANFGPYNPAGGGLSAAQVNVLITSNIQSGTVTYSTIITNPMIVNNGAQSAIFGSYYYNGQASQSLGLATWTNSQPGNFMEIQQASSPAGGWFIRSTQAGYLGDPIYTNFNGNIFQPFGQFSASSGTAVNPGPVLQVSYGSTYTVTQIAPGVFATNYLSTNGVYTGSFAGDGSGLTNVQVIHMGLVDSPFNVPDQASGGGNNCGNYGKHCIAMFPMTNILVGMPNFYGVSETGPGGSATVGFSVEYPIGQTNTSAVFGGTNPATYMAFDASRSSLAGTPASGSFVVGEVRMPFVIPTGAQYLAKAWYTNTAVGSMINVNQDPCRLDDEIEFGNNSGLHNRTVNLTTFGTGNSASFFYGPFFMAAMTTQQTILLVGASRERGIGECWDTNMFNRYGQRRLYTQHACNQIGISGCGSLELINNHLRLAAAPFAQIVVEGGLSINDVKNDGNDPVVWIPAVAALFTNGQPFYAETSYPKPSSTDGFATLANQTPDFAMTNYNTKLMFGSVSNVVGIDITGPLMNGPFSGTFAVNGLANEIGQEGPFYSVVAAAAGGDPISMGMRVVPHTYGGPVTRGSGAGGVLVVDTNSYVEGPTVTANNISLRPGGVFSGSAKGLTSILTGGFTATNSPANGSTLRYTNGNWYWAP